MANNGGTVGPGQEPTRNFSRLEFSGLQGEIFESLRRAILYGQLKPGERLVELELARQFNVSQTPVREALGRLVQEGLAVSKPRHGTFVVKPNIHDAEDIYSLRTMLERRAVERFIVRMRGEGARALRTCVSQMNAAEKAGDATAAMEADMQFHRIICEGSGSELVTRIWSMVDSRVRGIRAVVSARDGRDREDLAESHRPIVEAIEREDIGAAQSAIEHHCHQAWLDLRDQLNVLDAADGSPTGSRDRTILSPGY